MFGATLRPAFSKANETDSIYMYDISPKILGKSTVCFVFVNDSIIIKEIAYDISFTHKKKVTKISKTTEIKNIAYNIRSDSNIIVTNSEQVFYTSANFTNKKARFNGTLYEILGERFLLMSNKEKIDFLDSWE